MTWEYLRGFIFRGFRENDNYACYTLFFLRILYFVNVKSPQITNSRKSKHAKITRSTIYMVNLPSAEYTRLPNTHVSRLPSASASAEYTKPLLYALEDGMLPQKIWKLKASNDAFWSKFSPKSGRFFFVFGTLKKRLLPGSGETDYR